ncbi:MAG: hypothetical protein CMA12_04875 [Euryarchaeota archaeon]|nr:hypothetical protein [Euryarchaeota archaeon]
MSVPEPVGAHVLIDYVDYAPPSVNEGSLVLEILKKGVIDSGVRVVHSHVEEFDGSVSPIGFAAIVLIDESHVTAHCYSERGLLALDVFTCGNHDPDSVANLIHDHLISKIPGLRMVFRERVERFRSE